MSFVSTALDIVVAGLLIATIVYASVLNRKLATLRNTKQEMEALVNSLVESTDQTQRGLSDLKAAAGESGQALEQRVREARALADDLGFLVDRAGGLADRLETQIGKARAVARNGGDGAEGEAAGETGTAAKGRPKPRGRRELAQKSAKAGKLRAVSAAAAAGEEGDKPEETAPAAGGGDEAEPPANAKLLRALRGLR